MEGTTQVESFKIFLSKSL